METEEVLDFIIILERDIFQEGITLQMVYLMGHATYCAVFELICPNSALSLLVCS